MEARRADPAADHDRQQDRPAPAYRADLRRDGDTYLVVASNGGSAGHPAWYRNLDADPHVHVQVGAEEFDATARTATGDERERLWRLAAAVWPAYDDYQTRTERQIPVVVLTPVR